MSSTDLIDNPSTRCPCLLVLDTSGSMSGNSIRQLNMGVKLFIDELKKDEVASYSIDLAIITAGGHVTTVLDFTTVEGLELSREFCASGGTPLGEGVNQGLDLLENRKKEYQKNGVPYYQPWLVMISDGGPTDEWRNAAQRAKNMAENKKLVSLVVAVDGADIQTLGEFSNRSVKKLDGIKFSEFFEWLSKSMSRVSASKSTTEKVSLPPTDDWSSV